MPLVCTTTSYAIYHGNSVGGGGGDGGDRGGGDRGDRGGSDGGDGPFSHT